MGSVTRQSAAVETFVGDRMSLSSAAAHLSLGWEFYLEASRRADSEPLDSEGRGREEQLDEILHQMGSDAAFTPELCNRLNRLPWNRAKKHRALRRRYRMVFANKTVPDQHPCERLIAEEAMETIRRKLTVMQFEIESRLSGGQTYAIVTAVFRQSPGVLKMRVSRWRREVRRTWDDPK